MHQGSEQTFIKAAIDETIVIVNRLGKGITDSKDLVNAEKTGNIIIQMNVSLPDGGLSWYSGHASFYMGNPRLCYDYISGLIRHGHPEWEPEKMTYLANKKKVVLYQIPKKHSVLLKKAADEEAKWVSSVFKERPYTNQYNCTTYVRNCFTRLISLTEEADKVLTLIQPPLLASASQDNIEAIRERAQRIIDDDSSTDSQRKLANYILNENQYSLKHARKFGYPCLFAIRTIFSESDNALAKIKLAIAYIALLELIKNPDRQDAIIKTIQIKCVKGIIDCRQLVISNGAYAYTYHSSGKLERIFGISKEVNEEVRKISNSAMSAMFLEKRSAVI